MCTCKFFIAFSITFYCKFLPLSAVSDCYRSNIAIASFAAVELKHLTSFGEAVPAFIEFTSATVLIPILYVRLDPLPGSYPGMFLSLSLSLSLSRPPGLTETQTEDPEQDQTCFLPRPRLQGGLQKSTFLHMLSLANCE